VQNVGRLYVYRPGQWVELSRVTDDIYIPRERFVRGRLGLDASVGEILVPQHLEQPEDRGAIFAGCFLEARGGWVW
jgi:hypothetical protein